MVQADMTRLRVGVAAGLVMGLAGCATSYLPVDASGARTATSAEAPAPAGRRGDRCGASALAYLVGKPRSEIPVATDTSRRQVVCSQCPVDPAIRLRRQTITYDATTNLVTSVVCR